MSGAEELGNSEHLASGEERATDETFLARGNRGTTRRQALTVLVPAMLSVLALASPDQPTGAVKRSKDKDKNNGKGNKKDRERDKQKQSGGSGAEVARVAKKYKGSRYIWGGESPRGFDCSGFTWYCFDKAVGMEIGRTVEAQWKQGKSVGKGELKPGDIVFFKNTFKKGLSHNGISIGGGKFIHAENEETGVVISSLESGYYEDHYAGARRLV